MSLVRPRLVLLALAVTLAACDDPTGPGPIVPSILATEDQEPVLSAESSGGYLRVEYATYRNGCHEWAGDHVATDRRTRTLVIRAYDRILDVACFLEIDQRHDHEVALIFPPSGTWTVVVIGSTPSDVFTVSGGYEPAALETQVVVP